jgi:hypothetical protein
MEKEIKKQKASRIEKLLTELILRGAMRSMALGQLVKTQGALTLVNEKCNLNYCMLKLNA